MHNPFAPRLISLGWLRVILVLATWTVAAFAVLVVAAKVDLGPVVFELSYNHGVHALDLLAGVVAAMAATIVSVLVYLLIPSYILLRR